ncbi:MAG: 30S ribosomal protein S21 [Pseudomonadota bacterium]|nr:30S ribosomal protein S21 [Pseudomonadota bacterium]
MIPQKQKSYQQRKHFNKNKKFEKKRRPLSFDQLLRKFKKKVERSGIIQEVKKREYYEKPAQKRQRNMKEAIRKEKIRWEGDQLPRRDFW